MNLILITGLDGTGKSTLLEKLEQLPNPNRCDFLRVPIIDIEKFISNKEVYNASIFINKLNEYADEFKFPPLKVCALFSSMVIFNQLLKELKKNDVSTVFCERHPLIDTGVYAWFYADKMNPDTIPKSILDQLETQCQQEISYLLELIKVKDYDIEKGKVYAFINYIYTWFAIDKKFDCQNIKELFSIEFPDKIIYLRADPSVLVERISIRKILEAHENKAAFEQLIPLYDKVLHDSGVQLEIIDANDFENLDSVFTKLKSTYFSKE